MLLFLFALAMTNHQEIEIKNLDHLGIVAGIIDAIGIVDIINELISQDSREKVSAGHVIKAMILNGLGFVSSPLYMFPDFFSDKPCEHLIGQGVKAEYLNQYRLGRVIDQLFLKGITEIFLAITMSVMQKFNISLKSSHLDSTSMHLHGEYNTGLPEVLICNSDLVSEKSLQPIEITYGYSRDHRPDLKQFIIELISSSDGDIPIFLKAVSGNKVDSSSFAEIFLLYQKQIKDNEILSKLMVADAALYSANNISLLGCGMWV